jgi:hypothetical protein
MRLWLVSVILVAFTTAAVVVAPAAEADDAPSSALTTSPLDPAAPRTAIDLTRVRVKIERGERQLAVADARIQSAQVAVQMADSLAAANQVQLDAARAVVRDQAVNSYVRGSPGSQLLGVSAASDLSSAHAYASAALAVHDAELQRLVDLQQTLDDDRAAKADALHDAQTDRSGIADVLATLEQARAQDQQLLDRWGAVPVMGDTQLSAAQLAAWFRSTGYTPHLAPGTSIDDLARLYVVEATAEHVRGDLAFAQAVVETGFFQVAAGNNYSGIGVCDSCQGGYVFPTPLDGVRTQIQLLRNYADPDSRAAVLANPPSPTLYGTNPMKAAASYDSFFLKGKAPLWNEMGNGNWATDPTYAHKVIDLYARMLTYALMQPS